MNELVVMVGIVLLFSFSVVMAVARVMVVVVFGGDDCDGGGGLLW